MEAETVNPIAMQHVATDHSIFNKMIEKPNETPDQKIKRLEDELSRYRALAETQRQQLKVRFGKKAVAVGMIQDDMQCMAFQMAAMVDAVGGVTRKINVDATLKEAVETLKAQVSDLKGTLALQDEIIEAKDEANRKLREELEDSLDSTAMLSDLKEIFSLKNLMIAQLGDKELADTMKSRFTDLGKFIDQLKTQKPAA